MLPSWFLIKYLYVKDVPAGRLIAPVHTGLELVYEVALRATAEFVFQLPSCEMLPTMYTVCPKVVVRRSLKVTRVLVGVELHWPGVVGVAVRPGQAVLVAVAQGPVAEPREQEVGALAYENVSGKQLLGFRVSEVTYRGSAPRSRHGVCARTVGGEESGVGPGQVFGRDRIAV